MLQILDSSEIKEAITFACELTGSRVAPSPKRRSAIVSGTSRVLVSPTLEQTHEDEIAKSSERKRRIEKNAQLRNNKYPQKGLADGFPSASTKEKQQIQNDPEKSPIIDVTAALSSKDRTVGRGSARLSSSNRAEGSMEFGQKSFEYSEEKLNEIITLMCKRSNFSGAVVADYSGLPLAVMNPPVSIEAVSAFTSVLGSALERAGELLGHNGAEYLSMDINYDEKIVMRRFFIKDDTFFLMAISPQDVDERSEIEISMEQIIEVLSK